MKKFVFTLEPVYKARTALEKQKKTEYGKLQEKINALSTEKQNLEKKFEEHAEKYRCDITESLSTTEAANYIGYFTHVTEKTAELAERIRSTQEQKDEVLKELVELMKEIKTLDKLRESQYEQYRENAAKEDEKTVGDLVSYQSITSGQDEK